MDVTATGTTAASATASTAAATKTGKDEFLQLLTAQLANQDPTAPMDSTAFTAQLAQFSQLEQLQGVSSRLDSLLLAQTSANQTMAASLVGRDVVWRTDQVQLAADGAQVRTTLAAPAATVTVTVQDAAGRTVRTLRAGPCAAGTVALAWDGRDDDGNALPAGAYTVKAVAAAADGTAVDATPVSRARVDAVSFSQGFPQLLAGGARVQLSDVVEIAQGS